MAKKGQTDDLLADFIIGGVITIIALYMLHAASETHENNVNARIPELDSHLNGKIDYNLLLRSRPIDKSKGTLKEQEETCLNSRLTIADIISKINPANGEKDKCYLELKNAIVNLDNNIIWGECTDWIIEFPTKSVTLDVMAGCYSKEDQTEFFIPSTTGDYAKVMISKGVTNPINTNIT